MSTVDPGSTIWMYIIAGLIFSVGLFIIIFGWFGKRVDDHPWCRKCKFDLFGRDETSGDTCPECGSDLSKTKAIRIGQRQKRRGLILSGALIMLLGVSGLGVKGYTDAVGTDWQQHKPVWWLIREVNQPAGATSDAALAELLKRYRATELTASQTNDLIETALTHQANRSRTWQPDWGALIEEARQNNEVTDPQWQRYAAGALTDVLRLELRPRVVIGSDSLSVKIASQSARLSNSPGQSWWLEREKMTISIHGWVEERSGSSGGGLATNSSGSTTNHIGMSDDDWKKIQPGRHETKVGLSLQLFENGSPTQGEQALISKEIEFKQTVEFLPKRSSTVTVNTDPSIRQQVEDAIELETCRIRQWAYQKKKNEYHLDINLQLQPRPVDVVFEVWIRHEDVETKLGQISTPAASKTGWGTGGNVKTDLSGETIDIILRPSKAWAEATIDCFEIWGEEIVFKDVVVENKIP